MKFRDYYEVLGVPRDAAAADIKKAFRKLARKYHPDVSKEADAGERMSEINEAYAVLSDPERRAAYDELGRNRHAGEDFRPPPDWDAGFEFSGDPSSADFSEFFESLFGRMGAGRGRARQAPGRGEDHHAAVVLDLADAWRGAERQISFRVPQVDAQGRVSLRERTLNVNIPKGIREGQLIRLAGQGGPALGGGPPGDLFLEVRFQPHPQFRVDGRDVIGTLRVAPWEAALGAVVPVTLPDGSTLKVRIPAGTQSGKTLTVKGRGIPGPSPGDLDLEVQVVLPPADTPQARALYESMAREMAFDPRAAGQGARGHV